MTQTINYDQIAGEYAQTRAAAPWIIDTLARDLATLPAGAVVIELGCGTGNHVRALAALLPQHQYEGFDQSHAMLREAQTAQSKVIFRQGDAQLFWPYSDHYADIVFNVDVIHYIQDLAAFFREARRVLKPGGQLFIATDSEDDLRNRSLTTFFPEVLDYELARYPSTTTVSEAALAAGLTIGTPERVHGTRPITDEYVANLAAQCSSALRLISTEALNAGVERVRQAQKAGDLWHSRYTIYRYTKTS